MCWGAQPYRYVSNEGTGDPARVARYRHRSQRVSLLGRWPPYVLDAANRNQARVSLRPEVSCHLAPTEPPQPDLFYPFGSLDSASR